MSKVDIDHTMKDGWNALFYATSNGYMNIVELLVKEG